MYNNHIMPTGNIQRTIAYLKDQTHAFLLGVIGGFVLLSIGGTSAYVLFENQYRDKVYPGVSVGDIPFGGKTKQDVERYWRSQNEPFARATIEFRSGEMIATVSGAQLDLGYDATFSATQAYLVGRSDYWLSNLYEKFVKKKVSLTPYFRWNTRLLDEALAKFAQQIDIPVQDALFQFSGGRVSAFKPSKDGRRANVEETKLQFATLVRAIPASDATVFTIDVPVDIVKPTIMTDRVNSFGIKELVGRGYSEFTGSIPGRIHNVVLAASRLNGILIAPGEVFSFNNAVGDISAATGYQSAYIIKEGRTVLGDGGGVCQVSTTLFRAALAAGLPIIERRAHAYRVHYYEEGGFKPGLDATVFSPTVDLKFKNDTPAYILIQTKADPVNLTLTFELYGTHDGRSAQILNHKVWGESPPPPALYQEDPTLPKGAVRQVDFAAWGANASFQYRVTRGNEVLQDTTFISNFRPWQAVYLRGTQ